MIPKKCKETKCPRYGIDKNGKDVCILYQVSEANNDLVVLDVFNVGHKQRKRLKQEIERWKEDQNIGPIKTVAFVPAVRKKGGLV